MWTSIVQHKDTSKLNQFLLITFADLKKYQYYYWFAFPAFVAKPAWEIADNGWKPAEQQLSPTQVVTLFLLTRTHLIYRSTQLTSIFDALHTETKPYFIVKLTGDAAKVHAIDQADLNDSQSVRVLFTCTDSPTHPSTTDHHRLPGSLRLAREPRLASPQPPRLPPRPIPIPHHLPQRSLLARQRAPYSRQVMEVPFWRRIAPKHPRAHRQTHRARLGTPSDHQQTQRTHGRLGTHDGSGKVIPSFP